MIKNVKKIVIILLMLFWSFIVTGQDGCGGNNEKGAFIGPRINNEDISFTPISANATIQEKREALINAGVTIRGKPIQNANLTDQEINRYTNLLNRHNEGLAKIANKPAFKSVGLTLELLQKLVKIDIVDDLYPDDPSALALVNSSSRVVTYYKSGIDETGSATTIHEVDHVIKNYLMKKNISISQWYIDRQIWLESKEACSQNANPDNINDTINKSFLINNNLISGINYCPNLKNEIIPGTLDSPDYKNYGYKNMYEDSAVSFANYVEGKSIDYNRQQVHDMKITNLVYELKIDIENEKNKSLTINYQRLSILSSINNINYDGFIPGMSEENILLYAQADIENVFTIKNNKVYFFKSASPEIHSNYVICSNGIVEQIVLNSDSDINQNISTIISLYGQPSRMGYSYSSQSYKVYIYCNKGLLYVCDENDNIVQKHLFKKFDNINDFDKKYGNYFPDENPYIF